MAGFWEPRGPCPQEHLFPRKLEHAGSPPEASTWRLLSLHPRKCLLSTFALGAGQTEGKTPHPMPPPIAIPQRGGPAQKETFRGATREPTGALGAQRGQVQQIRPRPRCIF